MCYQCVLFRADEATIPKSASCSNMFAGCFEVHWYIVEKLLDQESVSQWCMRSEKTYSETEHLILLGSFVTASSLPLGCSWEHALELWHSHHNHWETTRGAHQMPRRRVHLDEEVLHEAGPERREALQRIYEKARVQPGFSHYSKLAMILSLIRPSL